MAKRSLLLLILFMLSCAAIAAEPAVSDNTRKAESDTILVDMVKGRIGDVSIRDSIEEIRKIIGPKRIKKLTEILEGDKTDYFEIDVKGHKIFKHWYATSFEDSIFRLPSGLGVGAKVKDFKKIYGNGEIIGGEGEVHLCFKSENPKYFFCINNIEDVYHDGAKFNAWPVKSLRVF